MNDTNPETLTAALRRLGDERASGVLEVAATHHPVLVALSEGVPTAIGPSLDVSARVGADAPPQLEVAAVIDALIDATVAAIVDGGGDWTWDVTTDEDLLPLPAGLPAELSRRAVDAAQALASLGGDAVLSTGNDVAVHGEAAALHAALDGERTLAEIAELLSMPLPTVAVWASALTRAGAAGLGDEPPDLSSWTQAVAEAVADDDVVDDNEDDSDDEPGLWVAEPEVEVAAEPAAAVPAPAPVTQPTPEPAAAGDGRAWNDTAWLDELAEFDDNPPTQPEPVHAVGDDQPNDARAAFTAVLGDLDGRDRAVAPASSTPAARERDREPAPEPEAASTDGEPEAEAEPKAAPPGKATPRAGPNDRAEFLRELSRLALDDD